jgi:hypothetical protein
MVNFWQFLYTLITWTTQLFADVAKGLKRRESTKTKKRFLLSETTSTLAPMHMETGQMPLGRNQRFLAYHVRRRRRALRALTLSSPRAHSSQIDCSDPPAAPSREGMPPSRKQSPAPPTASYRECPSPSRARPPAHQLSLSSASRPIDSPWWDLPNSPIFLCARYILLSAVDLASAWMIPVVRCLLL